MMVCRLECGESFPLSYGTRVLRDHHRLSASPVKEKLEFLYR